VRIDRGGHEGCNLEQIEGRKEGGGGQGLVETKRGKRKKRASGWGINAVGTSNVGDTGQR